MPPPYHSYAQLVHCTLITQIKDGSKSTLGSDSILPADVPSSGITVQCILLVLSS